jgi:acetyltransferase-like isoleucine patch superfamily enzyme
LEFYKQKEKPMKPFSSHGTGQFSVDQFGVVGPHVIFEPGVLVFHPENIKLGNNIYIGHYTILKGYHQNKMIIDDNTWIGQGCFFHSAGGIRIGKDVGIGPGVKIISSTHALRSQKDLPILHRELEFKEVRIDAGCDIGVGAIILPGVHICQGAQIGAGAVVNQDIPAHTVAVGVPAKVIA